MPHTISGERVEGTLHFMSFIWSCLCDIWWFQNRSKKGIISVHQILCKYLGKMWQTLTMTVHVFGKKTWVMHRCLNGMLSSKPVKSVDTNEPTRRPISSTVPNIATKIQYLIYIHSWIAVKTRNGYGNASGFWYTSVTSIFMLKILKTDRMEQYTDILKAFLQTVSGDANFLMMQQFSQLKRPEPKNQPHKDQKSRDWWKSCLSMCLTSKGLCTKSSS